MDDAQILQQAIAAIKNGDKVTGQKLLLSFVKVNPNHETALLWLSVTTDDITKKRQCLDRVLAINPNNETAKRGLTELQKQVSQPKQVEKIETPSQQVEPLPKSDTIPSTQSSQVVNLQPIGKPGTEDQVGLISELPPQKPASPKPLKVATPEATKKCPYCAEVIKAEAKICRFCSRDLEAGQKTKPTQEKEVRQSKKKRSSLVTCLIILGALSIVLCLCLAVQSPLKDKTTPQLPTPSGPTPTIGPTPTVGPTPIKFDEIGARLICEQFITEKLKAPTTADFSSNPNVYSVNGKPKNYAIVEGYVDAQNSFGAMIRSNYHCEVHYDIDNPDRWYLDYLEIK